VSDPARKKRFVDMVANVAFQFFPAYDLYCRYGFTLQGTDNVEIISNAGHMISKDQPELVINRIPKFIEA
jgi:hypothetical protein